MTNKTDRFVHENSVDAFNDFKVIHGIGSSVENRLHKAGIMTYRQLAEKSPLEIADLLKDLVGFTPERIAAQDWSGQASRYASEMSALEEESNTYELHSGQHYAVFTVELLLDGENRVRRTRVMHVQSQNDESWAGWDERRLQDFFVGQAALYLPMEGERGAEVQPELMKEAALALQSPTKPELQAATRSLAGEFRIQYMEPQYTGFGAAKRLIPAEQPFNMRLTLDLSELDAPANTPVHYSASLYAKEAGSGLRYVLGTSQGAFMPANSVIIDLGADKLSRGSYRMDAIVTLSTSNQEPQPGSSPMVMIEGGLFQVY